MSGGLDTALVQVMFTDRYRQLRMEGQKTVEGPKTDQTFVHAREQTASVAGQQLGQSSEMERMFSDADVTSKSVTPEKKVDGATDPTSLTVADKTPAL